MRLLLDTEAFILAAKCPERIPRRTLAAMDDAENILELSSVSITEIAIKSSRNKLEVSKSDVTDAITDLEIRILAFTMEHALGLFELPVHHSDPFDRQIIAQAVGEGIHLIGSDQKFPLYKKSGLKLLWN
jgi:PIN domain nuclease of toxin-antitoxin system